MLSSAIAAPLLRSTTSKQTSIRKTATDGDQLFEDFVSAATGTNGVANQNCFALTGTARPPRALPAQPVGTMAAKDGWRGRSIWRRGARQRSLSAVIGSKRPPLAWGMLPAEPATTGSRVPAADQLVPLLDRASRKKPWTGPMSPVETGRRPGVMRPSHRHSATLGLECLAWCHALPTLAGSLEANVWWKLFEALLSAAEEPDKENERGILTAPVVGGRVASDACVPVS